MADVIFDPKYGNLVTSDWTIGGKVIFQTAASQIVPGATTIALRNNANNADNLIITDAGVATLRSDLVLTAGDLKFNGTSVDIIQPVTSLLFRDHADANTNVTITDAGAVTIRAGLTVTASGITVTSGAVTITAGNLVISAGGQQITPVLLSVNGAITPGTAGMYVITKAGILADTIAAPTAGTDDGKIYYIVSSTANAHTITATGLFQTGGAAVNLATFANVAGASMIFMAYNGKFLILALNNVTMS